MIFGTLSELSVLHDMALVLYPTTHMFFLLSLSSLGFAYLEFGVGLEH
jgi:hypothetical protein